MPEHHSYKSLASAMEGLEDVDICQFTGIPDLQGAIDSQADRLTQGATNQQYLVFHHVAQEDLDKFDQVQPKFIRICYYSDAKLLILKLMPSEVHETAHRLLEWEFHRKVLETDLYPVGGTRYLGHMSRKEGDSAYRPFSRARKNRWPTLVFESGLSESLRRLRCDARWWFTNSESEVKIVLIILIKLVEKKMVLEKWELVPESPERPVTRTHHDIPVPSLVQEITILSGTGRNTVTGTPLVLDFQKIFLRPAVVPETDIIFTAEELSAWADRFWQCVN